MPRTLGFPGPDIKLPPAWRCRSARGVAIARQDERFAITANGWHLPAAHLAPIKARKPDFVAVAEEFLAAPYLWGGKTALGIDCSGLVQVALQAAGIACPRDSDMQELALGKLSSPASCGAATWCSGRATSPSRATARHCSTPTRMT